MSNTLTHLPHIKNFSAGVNKHDPMYSAIFEVYFDIPKAISTTQEDSILLSEAVTKVSGLDALQKMTGVSSQKFYGVDVSYLQPTLESTYADLEIEFNLNIRDGNDAYVFKILKAWSKMGYNIADGTRTLKSQYTADNMRVAEANRDGTIWRSYVFHDIFLYEISGVGELDYNNKDARKITAKFRADYWEEEIA